MSGTFAADIAAWAEATKIKQDAVLRAIALELLSRLVLRSPVGQPELWAANKHSMELRKTLLATAEANGKRLGKKLLRQLAPLAAGKGYVGGRFRGNWQVTLGDPAVSPIDTVDPSGATTLSLGSAVLEGAKMGVTIWMMNNLPYSERLEFGWSHQAPYGIVRVTAAEFESIVNRLAEAV